ncbi:MAG TPA: rod shape-determining protein MreC, partial [Kiloniellaceae bacterium]|nr:rod shape-determining protein MreC [Kiloniellaceae bacterium]
LAGDNTNTPELLYLGPTAKVQVGDYVTTSGHGGVFPPGLPIGRVAAVNDKGFRVQPFADWEHMEVLRIVDYETTGILDFEAQVGAARAAAAAPAATAPAATAPEATP